jgi:hypothetical protein
MKQLFLVALAVFLFCSPHRAVAQDSPDNQSRAKQYEYAIVKWDGPDRVYFNLPNKFELKFLTKEGVVIPREAQAEEFCLAWAANQMAKDGWTPTSFDSRRILFRRLKS